MPEVEKREKEVQRVSIEERKWQQPRVGRIDQVEMEDGRLKYNIQVTDVGRPTPFIDQYFSSEEAAIGLLDKVEKQSGGGGDEEVD
jgi:hypothetical protein